MSDYANGENLGTVIRKNEKAPYEGLLIPQDALYMYEACCEERKYLHNKIYEFQKLESAHSENTVTFVIIALVLGFGSGAALDGLSR